MILIHSHNSPVHGMVRLFHFCPLVGICSLLSSPDSYVTRHFLFYLATWWLQISCLLWNDEFFFQGKKRERKSPGKIYLLPSCGHQSFISVRTRTFIKRMTTCLETPSRETVIYLCVFTEYTEPALDTSHLLAGGGVSEQWSPGRPVGNMYPKQQTYTADTG